MKKIFDWQVTLAFFLILATALLYYLHFLIFRDPHHIFLYFIGDFAFVFFEVLLITMVIHRLLHHREQKALAGRRNMLIGAFFSETGTELLRKLAGFDCDSKELAREFASVENWSEREFLGTRESLENRRFTLGEQKSRLEETRKLLAGKKGFLLDLLQNSNLVENERFTDLVWAVFHLEKELERAGPVAELAEKDYHCLGEDVKRVYHLLLNQWLDYMKHLKKNYPSLFAISRRHNPFKTVDSVQIK